jgi:hypothetical protein
LAKIPGSIRPQDLQAKLARDVIPPCQNDLLHLPLLV